MNLVLERDRRASWQGELLGGSYRLLELIGAGSMGEVYAAEHTRTGRQFAVKVVRADRSPLALQRFLREAKAIARIENEHVVSVIDCGAAADGTPYLVMDLLRGQDLRCILDAASPLPIPRAVRLMRDVCRGLEAVHQAQLIHRDLKPENLFVVRRASGVDSCVILDFGVAKMDSSFSTASGAVIGTVKYMAPEQLRDGASAATAADIYALGAILYECLSGVAPHSGASVQELMFKVMNVDPAPLATLRPEVPVSLARAVHRALSKRAEDRFATVPEFARAIAPFAGFKPSPDLERRLVTSAIDRAPISASKRSPWPMLLTGLTIGIAFSVAGLGLSRQPSQLAPDSTLRDRQTSVRVALPPAKADALTAPPAKADALTAPPAKADALTAPPAPSLAPTRAAPVPHALQSVRPANTQPLPQAKSASNNSPALSFRSSTFEVENPYAQ